MKLWYVTLQSTFSELQGKIICQVNWNNTDLNYYKSMNENKEKSIEKSSLSKAPNLHNNNNKNMILKVDHDRRGKWFIHGLKHKENQLPSLEHTSWLSLVLYVNRI